VEKRNRHKEDISDLKETIEGLKAVICECDKQKQALDIHMSYASEKEDNLYKTFVEIGTCIGELKMDCLNSVDSFVACKELYASDSDDAELLLGMYKALRGRMGFGAFDYSSIKMKK